MNIYTLKNLTFAYPDIQSERKDAFLAPALLDVSLEVAEGSFTVIAGSSGCGKTTLLRQLKTCLAAHGRCTGTLKFCGEELAKVDPRTQAAAIGFVAQDVNAQLVTDKVWHELAFGLESLGADQVTIRSRVAEVCSFFGLNDIYHKKVNELSGGQKQLVNLAAVMTMSPKVLILDEPTSQLDPIAAKSFIDDLARVNRELGTTVIITEHRLTNLWQYATHVVAMDGGRVVYDGTPELALQEIYAKKAAVELPAAAEIALILEEQQVRSNDVPVTVIEGKNWLVDFAKNHQHKNKIEIANDKNKASLLKVKDAFFRYEKAGHNVLNGLSLDVRAGEILAINGANGSGKSTLLSVLAGVEKCYRGKVKKSGEFAVGYLPQDPKLLFKENTVERELAGVSGALAKAFDKYADRHPYDLSGGEQQKLALAKVLAKKPKLVLMDEPTKGMDVCFKRELAGILDALKKRGCSVVLVSHDIEFCAEVADRVCLIFDGQVAAEGVAKAYYAGNEFYTTAASRIARDVVAGAVTAEDVCEAFGRDVKREKNGSGKNGHFGEDVDDFENNVLGHGEDHERDNVGKSAVQDNMQDSDDSRKGNNNISKSNNSHKETTTKCGTLRKIALAITIIIMAICFPLTTTQSDLTALIQNAAPTEEGVQYLKICGIFVCAIIAFIILLRPYATTHNQNIITTIKKYSNKKTTIATIFTVALAVFIVWYGDSCLHNKKYYFISLLILLISFIPFLVSFENRKFSARDIVTIATLCAIGAGGRMAFFMLPNFSPVVALVIIAAVAFGAEVGFTVGAITMLVSNLVFGQGPWTPWQMLALGLCGFVAGVVFNGQRVKAKSLTRLSLCIFGGLSAIIIYGLIMNYATVVIWQRTVTKSMLLAAYISGFPFDVVLATSTVIFLWIAARPLLEKMDRIKLKYGVLVREKQTN